MKAKLMIIVISLLLTFSCSNDESNGTSNPSERRIVQLIVENFAESSQRILNIVYDSQGKVIEVNDPSGQIIETYEYNTLGKLIEEQYFDYASESNVLQNKDKTQYTYNSDNRISGVTETNSYYDIDGNFISESSVYSEVTYQDNMMIRNNTSHNYITEYELNDNNLIIGIKVYRNNVLKSDMSFSYDANGNCIAGNGPIDEGSLDNTTSNIDLSVVYGEEEKHPFFNSFFEYNILSTGQGFYNLKSVLVKQQGNRYAEQIEWYQYLDYTYKEVLNNTFNTDGDISSTILSELPNYPNHGSRTYIWE